VPQITFLLSRGSKKGQS